MAKLSNVTELRINRRHFAAGTSAAMIAAAAGRLGTSAQGTPASPVGSPAVVSTEPFKAAFVFIGPVGDLGWTYSHDQGRQALEQAMPNVTTSFVENVPESQADAERAIRAFAEEGNQLIIATSFGYGPAVLAVASQYPDIQFLHISGYQTAENVSTAFGKIEEPRYVSGFVAAKMSASGKLGYVAAFPIPEVIRGINAFTRGARSANPAATVQVIWTNTWYDPQTERDAAQALLDGGADVIAQHQDTTAPQQAAEAAGKYGVGYNVDMTSQAPKAFLTAPIWNWGVAYINTVSRILAGTWTTNQYWGSWQEGMVGLAPLATFIPEEIKNETMALAARFEAGTQNVFTVFTGPINGQDGTEKVASGVALTGEEILNMTYFVEGVSGEIPAS